MLRKRGKVGDLTAPISRENAPPTCRLSAPTGQANTLFAMMVIGIAPFILYRSVNALI
jgi:hypothetical protein